MIVYHPAYDSNHCAFRLISLLKDVEGNEINWHLLKILDFYFVFPHLLKNIRFPKEMLLYKKMLVAIPEPYETLPNPQRLMFELGALHNEVARALIARSLIDKELFLRHSVHLNANRIPVSLDETINDSPQRKTIWYEVLIKVLAKYQLEGEDGLKQRTNLMEYRYD